MDSKLLEYFLRVAELGSINKAASDLHVSQPALSRHMASLEHEVGAHLFTRSQSGVILTESGKLLADRARPLLRQFDLVKEQVGEVAAGYVSIGIPTSWQNVFTIPLIEQMLARFPGVTLRVHEGVSHVLRDYMFAGLLDLCIVPFSTSPASGYRQTALVREPLVLVGDHSSKFSPDHPTSLSALDGVKLVLPGRPNVLRSLIEQSLSKKGLNFRLAVETDTLALCIDLARKGIGCTVVPACAMDARDKRTDITWSPLKGTVMSWALCENSARTHSQVVREARKLVYETVARSLGTGEWLGAVASTLPRTARTKRPLEMCDVK